MKIILGGGIIAVGIVCGSFLISKGMVLASKNIETGMVRSAFIERNALYMNYQGWLKDAQ